jgi:hypothetical protein
VSFGQRRDEERREGKKEQKKRNGMLYYAVWWEGKIVQIMLLTKILAQTLE